MPKLCVWSACRVSCISAFSVSSYETSLARWCTREIRIPCEPAGYPFARSGTSLNTSGSIRIHNFQVGSIRFSILVTKATAIILTFRYSTQCTEDACLNITSRQCRRILQSSSQVPSIKLFCVCLSVSLLPSCYTPMSCPSRSS
jgi:hypothetical protein